jgi:hypothetical protein
MFESGNQADNVLEPPERPRKLAIFPAERVVTGGAFDDASSLAGFLASHVLRL